LLNDIGGKKTLLNSQFYNEMKTQDILFSSQGGKDMKVFGWE
jgi:hypothetical protein